MCSYVYDIGLKVVPIYMLQGQSTCYMGTWTLFPSYLAKDEARIAGCYMDPYGSGASMECLGLL